MATGLTLPFSNTPPAPKVFGMAQWMPDATPAEVKPPTGNERRIQVNYATTANLESFDEAPLNIDGWETGGGAAVLVQAQTDPNQNGIYMIQHATAALLRHPDYATPADYERGVIVGVTRGDINGGKAFKLSAPGLFDEFRTALVFVEMDPTAVVASAAAM